MTAVLGVDGIQLGFFLPFSENMTVMKPQIISRNLKLYFEPTVTSKSVPVVSGSGNSLDPSRMFSTTNAVVV